MCVQPPRILQVMLNEEVDPSLVIRRLKQEIRDLREEIRLIRGEAEDRGPLTPDELKRLSEQVCGEGADVAGGWGRLGFGAMCCLVGGTGVREQQGMGPSRL